MDIALKIFELIVQLLGCCTLFILVYISIDLLGDKIEKFMKRQSKIRCLCQHEYEQKFAWRIGVTDYKEVTFQCRKCGKILKANIVVGEVGCE